MQITPRWISPKPGRMMIMAPAKPTKTGFDYDGAGRLSSTTSTANTAESYMVTYLYDNLDRRIKTTYPDGTFEAATKSQMSPR